MIRVFSWRAGSKRPLIYGAVCQTLEADSSCKAAVFDDDVYMGGGDDVKDDLIICFQANQRDEARTMNAAGVLASKIGMKQQSFFSLPDKPRHTEDKRQCLGIYDSTNPIPTLSAAHHHAACFLRKDEEMELKPKLRVRRLLPVECERLMGLPDDWTKIPWNGKPAEECPDSHRYKACGNSMGVNCMRWIGIGIDEAAKRIKTKEGGGK